MMLETSVNGPEVLPISEFCPHAKVVIPDALGHGHEKIVVDAEIAPLVAELRDCYPYLACQDETGDGESMFLFLDRSDAIDFIDYITAYGRTDRFFVEYCGEEIHVGFPRTWIPGLTEFIRADWERIMEERRAQDPFPDGVPEPHPTVRVDEIEIDADLAPLIRSLWDAGVQTSMCCQEWEPGVCWIQFPSPDHALKFFIPSSKIADELSWTIDDRHEFGDDLGANPVGCVSVTFPRGCLGSLTRAWQQRVHSHPLEDYIAASVALAEPDRSIDGTGERSGDGNLASGECGSAVGIRVGEVSPEIIRFSNIGHPSEGPGVAHP